MKKLRKLLKIFRAFKKQKLLFTAGALVVILIGSLIFVVLTSRHANDTKLMTQSDSASTSAQAIKPNTQGLSQSIKNDGNADTKNSQPSQLPTNTKNTTPAQTSSPSSAPSQNPTHPPINLGNTTVTPNPYCPAPNFSLAVSRKSNSYDLLVSATPAPGDPSSTPACGGAINFGTPVVTYPTNPTGLCSGLIYTLSNTEWGMDCAIYGTAAYGVYTFTLTVTGINGYNKSTTHSISYTYNYQPE